MAREDEIANHLQGLIGSTLQDVLGNNYVPENENQKNRKRRDEICKLFKIVHRELLTRPLCRRLRPWPNPKFEGPREITQNALTGKIPGHRLKYLAQPRRDNEYCDTYFPEKPSHVHEYNEEKTSINMMRLIKLSKPRPTLEEEVPLDKKSFKSKKEWLDHLKKLQKLAAARRTPQSPLEPKRIKKPLEKFLPRLNELSQPSYRPLDTNEWTYEELTKMKNLSLKYKPSERIQKLANARSLNEETLLDLKYDPLNRISKAIKYKATERIEELSKPIIRNQQKRSDADDKSSAFKVNPRALKAWCSPRIKKLAKPIVRD